MQAQEADVTALMEAMDKNRDEATAGEKKEDGYKSFVQNEYQNIFANIKDLDQQEIEDITFAEINNWAPLHIHAIIFFFSSNFVIKLIISLF